MTGPSHTAAAAAQVVVVSGASQVATCAPDASEEVGLIVGGAVAIDGERILAVGTKAEVAAAVGDRPTLELDAAGGTVIPGYIDPHTHLIFAGDRSHEFFARAQGMDEERMRALGIAFDVPASIAANRGLSVEALVAASLPRLRRMLACGTTTIETKSGYGLDPESDRCSLLAARRLAELVPVEISTTYLGAHTVPPDSTRERFLDEVVEEVLPRVAEEGLAEFCDVYCDPNVFDLEETARVLRRADDLRLKLKMHVDAKTNIGGTRLAAEMRATSVDHVNYTTRDDFRALATAGTVAVTFPGFDHIVAHPARTDIEAVRESGVTLAIGTDLCPVCWLESMQLASSFGCRSNRMSPQEALRASTINAAKAIDRAHEIGSIEPGKQADLVILDVPSYEQAMFRFGVNSVAKVIKKGRLVVDRSGVGDETAAHP